MAIESWSGSDSTNDRSRVPRTASANLMPAAVSRGPLNAPHLAAVQPASPSERGHELERVLAGARDEQHVILLGGHPDPDAIASALAMSTSRSSKPSISPS